MKKIIYLYILDTMADWEASYVLQAIGMEPMLKKGKKEFEIRTVSIDKNPIKTMGGLTIVPEYTLDEIDDENTVALLLPGGQTWNEGKHKTILEKAVEYIEKGILVGAICGSVLPLADRKILDEYGHTGNALDYLIMFSKNYGGKELYMEAPAFIDRNLLTASSAGGLLWAKYVLEYLEVFSPEKIEAWYNYFSTGNPKYYMDLVS